ncbi:WD40 repeat domain-containing protein [Janthinobacterium sp. HLS12-2]|uniref:WD40 repeat domain-containing protein n=1 Tax=Janthinobacterium sp. HLS12-2 TaxID=1259324 RepID=UPI003F24309A
MITKLMDGLPNQSMAQVPFDEAVAKYMTELPLRGAEENALLADVKSKQVLVNESAASAAASVNAATTQATAAQAARDAAIEARNAAQAAASDAHEAATGTVLTGTSTTPLVIGTGNKTLATQAGKQYAANIFITAVSASDPTRFMTGTVTSYVGTTLTIAVTAVGGNGDTKSDWNISVTGAPGAAGSAALTGNATGAINLLKGTAPAASATPDIWAAGGNRVPISFGTTITGFPAAPQAGAQRTLVATVAFSITNGANLVIAGGSTTLNPGDEIDITADTSTLFKAWVRRSASSSGALTGDILTTARALSAPDWLKCDGGVYLQSAYPGLRAVVGLLLDFTTTPAPATLPTGQGRAAAYSPDGTRLAIGHDATPFLTVYTRSGATLTKLADPATLPASAVLDAAWSPDGTYLAVAHATTPFLTVYKWNGSTLTKLSNPAALPVSASSGVSWNNDGSLLAVGGASAALSVYSRSGDVFTKLSVAAPNSAGKVKFNPAGTMLACVATSSPYLVNYSVSGATLTSLGSPSVLPTVAPSSAAWSPDGAYLTLVGGTAPFVETYSVTGTSLAKLSTPADPPGAAVVGLSYSSDGRYLALSGNPTVLYSHAAGVLTKLSMPGFVSGAFSQALAFTPGDEFLGCALLSSPYVQNYTSGYDRTTQFALPKMAAAAPGLTNYIKT